jgi:hypothetical protein
MPSVRVQEILAELKGLTHATTNDILNRQVKSYWRWGNMNMTITEKRRVCQICGNERVADLHPGILVRPPVAELIQKQVSSSSEKSWICTEDRQRFRHEYVRLLLEAEEGEITTLDQDVLESLRQQDILSRNPEEDSNQLNGGSAPRGSSRQYRRALGSDSPMNGTSPAILAVLIGPAQQALSTVKNYPKLDEITFDADRMRLTLVHELREGPTALCKGAPETVLPLCSTFLTNGEIVPLSRGVLERVLKALTALDLGVERPNPQVIRRPPRPQRERLLNWSVALRAYLFLGLIESVASMAAFFFVLYGGGWKPAARRPSLSPSHDRVLERHHRDADRECIAVAVAQLDRCFQWGCSATR